MRLLRRFGPILSGIHLDASADHYTPEFHFHCLLRPFPAVSLAAATKYSSSYVHLEWHENAYRDLAAGIRIGAAGFMRASLRFGDFSTFCYDYLKKPAGRGAVDVLESVVLTAGWLQARDFGRQIDSAKTIFSTMPEAVQKQLGGADRWIGNLEEKATTRAALDNLLQREIEKHSLQGIRTFLLEE